MLKKYRVEPVETQFYSDKLDMVMHLHGAWRSGVVGSETAAVAATNTVRAATGLRRLTPGAKLSSDLISWAMRPPGGPRTGQLGRDRPSLWAWASAGKQVGDRGKAQGAGGSSSACGAS